MTFLLSFWIEKKLGWVFFLNHKNYHINVLSLGNTVNQQYTNIANFSPRKPYILVYLKLSWSTWKQGKIVTSSITNDLNLQSLNFKSLNFETSLRLF